jgi:hypothetical protein
LVYKVIVRKWVECIDSELSVICMKFKTNDLHKNTTKSQFSFLGVLIVTLTPTSRDYIKSVESYWGYCCKRCILIGYSTRFYIQSSIDKQLAKQSLPLWLFCKENVFWLVYFQLIIFYVDLWFTICHMDHTRKHGYIKNLYVP